MQNKKGITLSELLVTSVIFLIFTASLMALISMGTGYWKGVDKAINAQEVVYSSIGIIASEMRQGLPDPDPGTGHSPTGYFSIAPPVSPTAILYPNANSQSGNYVEFTEPNNAVYNLSSISFNANDPSNYQRVKYYVNGSVLYRDATTYDSGGNPTGPVTTPIVDAGNGSISVAASYISTNIYSITVTSVQDTKSYNLTYKVFIMGR
ncbi:MAG: type II secretion system GspH family protein [Firmicutes bacterium]|nr:type II secretion system GspH family protein [Bacillota bacterium]